MPGQDDSLLGRIERFGPTLTRDLPIPRGLVGGTPPDQPISLRDLRLRLLAPGTPGEVRDQVWAWLVSKVRADRGEWHTAALLLAMPALRRQTRVLAMHRPNARDGDGPVQANLAVEFVFALHRVDLDRPHVAARLIDAASYAARGGRTTTPRWVSLDHATAAEANGDAIGITAAGGSPEQVLRRLVNATHRAKHGRISALDAELIARTYLEHDRPDKRRTLAAVAAELGLSVPAATMRRRRAVTTVARLLGRPDLAAESPAPDTAPRHPNPAGQPSSSSRVLVTSGGRYLSPPGEDRDSSRTTPSTAASTS
jgi:hypothetical protein